MGDTSALELWSWPLDEVSWKLEYIIIIIKYLTYLPRRVLELVSSNDGPIGHKGTWRYFEIPYTQNKNSHITPARSYLR